MFEFVSLFFADRYMHLTDKQKRHKLMRLERIDRFISKIFRWCLIVSMFLCTSWNIDLFSRGLIIRGILDVFIEYLIYPAVLLLECHYIKQDKFGVVFVMIATLLVMLLHTPTYSLMIAWCTAFVIVRFCLSGMQRLPGYPDFHDDLRGKHTDVALTEEQRFAVFQSDVKRSNKYLWEQEEKHDSAEILSGNIDLDGYLGVKRSENPGEMDEVVIPDDLDLENAECFKRR